MKIALIGLLSIGVLIGVFMMIPEGNNTQNQTPSVAGAQSTNRFSNIQVDMQSGSPLIDVRTPEEYAAGHIEGAINLPLADIQSGAIPEVAKNTKLYVYCRSGNRSAQASKMLKDAGFSAIEDLGAMTSVVAMGGKETR
ncbi:MAG TPA: rhodanese-like domain-containing protein [Candidatus Saccharibacteria bacterium]|nr:rhodanese-like domain-containing protein [Candidatus Saccharibacteria bacterium]HMT56188.1 rhodanese-like domain-containing protein [Candidatus Saccharibacteria bacterium]